MTKKDDLVKILQSGPSSTGYNEAFTEVYNNNLPLIRKVCTKMVKGYADDMIQETFLTLHNKVNTFKGESSLTTWLYRIAVNKCLVFIRSQKCIPEMVTEYDSRKEAPPDVHFLDSIPGESDPLKRIIARE